MADPGFAKGWTDHGESAECEPKWGSGAEPPAGSVKGAKLKAFYPFSYKKVAKS